MFFQSGRDSSGPPEPLYSGVQRFYIKNGFGEERPRDLRINVDLTSAYSKISKHVLSIQVLDDDDPFFYYALTVTEDDYLRLKTSQGLLVDFDSFPAQVVRLLEHCKSHESHSSKFHLLLEEEGRSEFAKTLLKIVETNNFKHLCHLVLHIDHGSDEDIKKIMVRKIKSLKEQNSKAEKAILSLESQLSSKNMMLEAAEMKVNEVEHRWKEDKRAFQAETAKGLSDETEKLRRAQLDWQIKSQREKAELEERFHNTLKEKDGELSKMRIENQILSDKRGQVEVAVAEQAKRIEVLERELASVRSDLATSRKQLSKLDSENRDKERMVSNLKSKLSSVEQELKEKAMFMSRHEELVKAAQEQKTRLEATLQEKEAYIAKKQKTIHNVSEELIKANDIISKLQKELTVTSTKLKTRTEIALEQEKVIERNEKVIDRLEREVKMKSKKLDSLDESGDALRNTISELKESLEAREKKISENEKIIDWLNRRCTEVTVQSYNPSYPNLGIGGLSGIGLGSSNLPPGHPGGTLGHSVTPNMVPPTPLMSQDQSAFKTSTPFERFKENSRIPFTTPPSRFNILSLDKMETPVIVEEDTSENDEPSPKAPGRQDPSPKELVKIGTETKADSDKKKASPVDPPKISTKPSFRKTPTSKKTPLQTPNVPSSYFLS